MNIDHLEKIQKAEPSPFLFTRIQQRVSEKNSLQISKLQIRLIGLSFAVIICINAAAIFKFFKTNSSVETFAQTIQLNSENSLY